MDSCVSNALTVAVISDTPSVAERMSAVFQMAPGVATLLSPRRSLRTTPFDACYDVVCIDRATVAQLDRELRRWRRQWPSAQLIVLNVRDTREMCRALDAGADEAMTGASPCCDSRLRAVARRARIRNSGRRLAIADIVFDREARRVWCAGKEVRLTPKECAVLDCLFRNDPRPVGIPTLTEFVWHGRASRDVVEVYVGYVRRKLAASKRVMLRKIRGIGYRFVETAS